MKTQKINFERLGESIKITKLVDVISFEDFIYACEDFDFSLDSHVTGHLTLIDDRNNEIFLLDDHWVDSFEVLIETGEFIAKKSILDYSDFRQD